MEAVGGYEQLMNMPLPAMRVVAEYLNFIEQQRQKSLNKAKARKK
jgi:hypothetical protein